MEKELIIDQQSITNNPNLLDVDMILESWLKLQKLIKEEITINEICNLKNKNKNKKKKKNLIKKSYKTII
jgi:hypothetical protein